MCVPEDRLRALLDTAFKERLPETQVHRFFSDLAMSVQDDMQEAVISDDHVDSAMANANYDGIDEVYFEEEVDPNEATLDEPLMVTIPGQVNLGIDTERPYAGHQLQFKVAVTLARCGLRYFEAPQIEVRSAGLDYDWGDDDPPQRRTLAQALAEELNIDMIEAEELTDVEAQPLTGNGGELMYSYLFDFTKQVSPQLAARLMAQHGSLQLQVGPWFFETLRGPDERN